MRRVKILVACKRRGYCGTSVQLQLAINAVMLTRAERWSGINGRSAGNKKPTRERGLIMVVR